MKTLCDRYSRSGVWNTCIHKQRKSSLQRGRKPGACLNYAGFTRINAKIKHSVSVMCKFRAVARLGRSLSSLSSSLSEWLHGLIQSEIPNWCSCTPVIPAGLCDSQSQCNTIDNCAMQFTTSMQYISTSALQSLHWCNTIRHMQCNSLHQYNIFRQELCKIHYEKFQFKNSMGFDSI